MNALNCYSYSKLMLLLLATVFFSLPALAEQKLPFKIPTNPGQLYGSALIETTKGPIEIEFYRKEALVTVANFQYLIKKGFYNNLTFHRYVEGYVLQGGDPEGNGRGGPSYFLPPEFSSIKHRLGTFGMARKPDPVNEERLSNGSQFYVTLDRAEHFDGLYSVFARVINGMENLLRLREGDRIIKILLPKSNR